MIEIINRDTKAVLYTSEKPTLTEATIEGVARGANLRGANLRDAYLGLLRSALLPDAPDAATLRANVAAHIEAHPELHDQASWGDGKADPSCGTPCCVAGWACHLGGGDRGQGVSTAATLLLHLEGAETPSFEASTPREEILAALRSTPQVAT